MVKISYFDFSERRRPEITRLYHLKKGVKIIHDHQGYDTPMRVWIAQQRPRLKKDFEVSLIAPGKGKEPKQFYIWWTRKWRKGQRHKKSRKLLPRTPNKTEPKWEWVYCPKRKQAIKVANG